MVIAVAILVVAPKDLPGLLRAIGFYMGKAKRMANDVQKQINETMHQAEIESMRQDINKAANEAKSSMSVDLSADKPLDSKKPDEAPSPSEKSS